MKHIIFIISLLVFLSCKDNKHQEIKSKSIRIEKPVAANEADYNVEASNIYENAWTKEMVKNNGAKWEANAETNEGVQKMQNSIKNTNCQYN